MRLLFAHLTGYHIQLHIHKLTPSVCIWRQWKNAFNKSYKLYECVRIIMSRGIKSAEGIKVKFKWNIY